MKRTIWLTTLSTIILHSALVCGQTPSTSSPGEQQPKTLSLPPDPNAGKGSAQPTAQAVSRPSDIAQALKAVSEVGPSADESAKVTSNAAVVRALGAQVARAQEQPIKEQSDW